KHIGFHPLLSTKERLLDSILGDPFYVSVRETFEATCHFSQVDGMAHRNLPKQTAQQCFDFFSCRFREHNDFVETPPQGRIEQALVVGRRDSEYLRPEVIKKLKKGIYNTF